MNNQQSVFYVKPVKGSWDISRSIPFARRFDSTIRRSIWSVGDPIRANFNMTLFFTIILAPGMPRY